MGRKAWFKLWQDRLLGSIKWRRLPYQPRSLYLHLMLLCDAHGRLEVNNRPLTTRDIRDELTRPGDRRPRTTDVQKWLDELCSVGLLKRDQTTYWLGNFETLQRHRAGTTRAPHGPDDGTPGRDGQTTYDGKTTTPCSAKVDPCSPQAPGQPSQRDEARWREMAQNGNPQAREYAHNCLRAAGLEK